MKKGQFLFMMLLLKVLLQILMAEQRECSTPLMLKPLHHAGCQRGTHGHCKNSAGGLTLCPKKEKASCPKKENTYGQALVDMADQDTEVRALLTARILKEIFHP